MWRNAIFGLTLLIPGLFASAPAPAAGDMTKQQPIEVRVSLGTAEGMHKFVPSELRFETGRLYKLVLVNPSKVKHYFTSQGLAARVYTRKVQVVNAKGTIAEIKGSIREIEVYPGGTTEWWFVPVATGKFSDLHCHIRDKDGQTHAAKGMVGTIIIE